MNTSFEKYQKRRLRSSYFSVIMSIAFVLFLIGLLGLLVLNTKNVSDYFKEQASVTIFLNDDIDEAREHNSQLEVPEQVSVKAAEVSVHLVQALAAGVPNRPFTVII